MVVIPYVENVSEAVARIMRKHNAPVAMKPYITLKSVLVHPKDKQEKEDLTECVYKVPCANCDKTYISKTGKKFGVRLHEHRNEVESKTGRTFTRSIRASSLTEHHKSALTDHATQENHVINSTGLRRRWSTESQSVLPDGSRRPYTPARKENRPWTVMRAATNWAAHTTAFLTRRLPVASRIGRTEYQLLLIKASDRGRNVKF